MVTITFIEHNERRHQIDAQVGQSVMRIAKDNNVEGISADCGGCAACATCHVFVDHFWLDRLPAPAKIESELLECAFDRDERSRLSCQIVLTEALDGLILYVPAPLI